MIAISNLSPKDQNQYQEVRQVLLFTCRIFINSARRKAFQIAFDLNNPEEWLRKNKLYFQQWLNLNPVSDRQAMNMELVVSKLPS